MEGTATRPMAAAGYRLMCSAPQRPPHSELALLLGSGQRQDHPSHFRECQRDKFRVGIPFLSPASSLVALLERNTVR
jgi:hypothetical protein